MKLEQHDQNLFTRLKWTAREPEIADEMLRILIKIDGMLKIDEEIHSAAQHLLSLIMSRAESRMVA